VDADVGGNDNWVNILIEWGDGTFDTLEYGVELTNPFGNFYVASNISHDFPATTTECSYTSNMYLMVVDDVCTTTETPIVTPVWDTDNEGSGELIIQEESTGVNVYQICEGYGDTIIFVDNSTLNCNVTENSTNPNDDRRWIQFQYGTFDNGAYAGDDRIPQITVNGTQVTDASGNLIADLNGDAATRELDGSVEIYDPPNNSLPPSGYLTDTIIIPAGVTTVGDVFEIRLRNWNYCNQYDTAGPAPGPNGDFSPVTTTAIIEIIDAPLPPVAASKEICTGGDAKLTAVPGQGGTTINWYSDAALTNLVQSDSATFDPSVGTAENTSPIVKNTEGGPYTYYVAETLTSTLCEGPADTVTIMVWEQPATPTVGGGGDICADNYTDLGGSIPTAGTGTWEIVSGGGTITDDSNRNTGVTAIPEGDNTYRWKIVNGVCADSADIRISRYLQPDVPTVSNDDTVCATSTSITGSALNVPGSGGFTTAATTQTWTTSIVDVWDEDFNLPDGTTIDNGLTAWTTDISGGENDGDSHLKIMNGRLEAQDVGGSGQYVWESESIDISGLDKFEISFDVAESGDMEPEDYVKATYQIDSNPEFEFYSQTNDFPANNTFYTQSVSNLSGTNTLVLKFKFRNSQTSEKYYIEYVTVKGYSDIPDQNNTTTNVTGLVPGENTFIWTISNGVCPDVSDTVVITRDDYPSSASVGTDATVCAATYADLGGNTPLVGTGTWTLTGGSGTIDTPGDPNSSVSDLVKGANEFTWTISNGLCADSSASITIIKDSLPTSANIDLASADTCEKIYKLRADSVFEGHGKWTVVSKPPSSTTVTFSNDTVTSPIVTVDEYGIFTFRWTSTSDLLVCDSTNDEITVTFYETPSDPEAGLDDTICSSSYQLKADSLSVGTGKWSLFSGNVTIGAGDSSIHEATITNIADGDNFLIWSATEGVCPVKYDTVLIRKSVEPATADAGIDQQLCDTLQSEALNGSDPAPGTGIWSKVSGAGGIIFSTNENDRNTQITVPGFGIYEYEWFVKNETCESRDTVLVDYGSAPTDPDASVADPNNDTTTCFPDFTLGANGPVIGTGAWSHDTAGNPGNAVFGNVLDSVTSVTVDSAGDYKFIWTISSGSCVPKTDTVFVKFYPTPNANANVQDSVCSLSYELKAIPSIGSVTEWSPIPPSDGDTVSFVPDFRTDTTIVTVDSYGSYTFQWIESAGTADSLCRDTATVNIIFHEQPSADAGLGGDTCDTDFQLNASASVGTGTWTLVGGTGTAGYDNQNASNAIASASKYGIKQFEWEENNSNCTDKDTITVNFWEPPTAEAGLTVNACDTLTATFAGTGYSYSADPQDETDSSRYWKYISGPDATPVFADSTDPNTTVETAYYGTYVFQFTEINGTCSDSDQVTVNYYEKPVANAGINDTIEVSNAKTVQLNGIAHTYLAAPNVNAGTIKWEKHSGPGNLAYTDQNNDTTSVTATLFGEYEIRIVEINGTCSDTDFVRVFFYEQPVADAGDDIDVCGLKNTPLSAVLHTYAGGGNQNFNQNKWEMVTSPGGNVIFSDSSAANSTVTVDYYGEYILRFIQTNGTCSDSNLVTVTFYEQPITEAGDPINICGSTNTVFAATAHTYDASPNQNDSTLEWKYVSGPDATPTITDPSSASSAFSVDYYGEYVFRFVETNGICGDSDQVTVTFYEQPIADGGLDGDTCDALEFSLDATEYGYAANPNENSGTNSWYLLSSSSGGTVTNWGSGQGTPDPDITVNLPGVYEFAWVEANGTCNDTAFIEVGFWQPASVFAGSDESEHCQGYAYNFTELTSSPAATNYDSLKWVYSGGTGTDVGDGSFNNTDTNLVPVYTPAATETGDVRFTLIAYAQGSCSDVLDEMQLSIKPTPQTSAINGDTNVCVNSSKPYAVTQHAGSTYNWAIENSVGDDPDFNIGFNLYQEVLQFKATPWTGTLRVVETSSNGCVGDTIRIDIQSFSQPTVEAGDNVSICAGDSAILGGTPNGTGPSATGGSGSYTYNWSPSFGLNDQLVEHPFASPSINVDYTLKVTDNVSGCPQGSDLVSLTVNPIPDAPDLSSEIICYGEAVPALTATGINVTWYSDAALTDSVSAGNSYTPADTAVGTYTYYAIQENASCTSQADSTTLTTLAKPVITGYDTTNQSVCNSNDGEIIINATGSSLEYSINSGTSWQSSNTFSGLGNALYPSAVRDAFGCISYGDTLEIESGDQPNPPVAGTDRTYCDGETLSKMNAVEGTVGGILTWYDDAGLTNVIGMGNQLTPYDSIATIIYYVTETAGGCESPASSVTITINSLPAEPLASDKVICFGEPVPDLVATGDVGSTIKWYASVGLTNLLHTGDTYTTGQTSGTENYYVTQTVSSCVSDANEVILQIKTRPNQLSVDDESICYGEDDPTFSSVGTNIEWFELPDSTLVSNTNDFTPDETGPDTINYYVIQTQDGCSSVPEEFTYAIKALPNAPVADDTFACEYTTPKPKLFATGQAGSTIKWYEAEDSSFITSGTSPHILNISHNNVDTTQYLVTQTVNACESDYDQVEIIIYPRPGNPVASDTTFCFGGIAELYASGESGGTIIWYDKFGTTPLDTGNTFLTGDTSPDDYDYSVRQHQNGCQSFLKGVTLTINPVPTIDSIAKTDETACESNDGTITIYASSDVQ
ncbi:hypothetical protein ACFLSA_05310, partial [Bacteroidota bacterium]